MPQRVSAGAALADTAGGPDQVQQLVDTWFELHAADWQDIYQKTDVFSVLHQHRMALALAYVDRLRLPPGARALEIGCGAGLLSLALAERGLAVTATDVVPAMLRLTHQRATAARVDGCVELASSDAHQLTFPNETFDVVVTLGVLPWLHTPRQAVQEIARVLRPGGHLIANVDNLWRLSDLLDPRLNPFLGRARRAVRGALIRAGLVRPRSGVRYKSHSIAEFDRLLGSLDFELEASRCYGFGPFTIFGQRLMPDHLDVAVHRGLQALADRGTPGLRSTGGVYMVLARKRLAA